MTRFTISILINKPTEFVTEALNNPDNHTHWTKDLVKFEVIKGKANKVGAVARLHYVQKGREYIMEDELIYCEPGKRYISSVSGDAINATVETTLKPLENKTEMTINWSGKGRIFILKLLLPILRKKIEKQGQKELETFKNLVETRGSNFNDLPDNNH